MEFPDSYPHMLIAFMQDNSKEEVLRWCHQLKECSRKLNLISSTLQISLCYGRIVCVHGCLENFELVVLFIRI